MALIGEPRVPVPHATAGIRNLGNGRFEELIEEAGPGIAAAHASRGCAFGDFDNDGDVDVLVMNMNEPPSLLRNDVTGGGHWLKVLLQGVKSNRQRDRCAGHRALRRPAPGPGRDGAVEFLLS